MADHPGWLLALLAEVEQYEDVHGNRDEGWHCFGISLAAVPAEVRAMARGYGQARREPPVTPPENVVPHV